MKKQAKKPSTKTKPGLGKRFMAGLDTGHIDERLFTNLAEARLYVEANFPDDDTGWICKAGHVKEFDTNGKLVRCLTFKVPEALKPVWHE